MPQTFKDTAGRTWALAVNVAAIKRVRTLTGVDLFAAFDDGMEGWAKLTRDVVLFIDVLFALAAEGRGVTDVQFGEAMSGDVLDEARAALAGALIDFFPDARRRAALKEVMAKSAALQSLLMDRAKTEAEKIDPAKAMAEIEAHALKSASTPSPASSESIPAPSPSAN